MHCHSIIGLVFLKVVPVPHIHPSCSRMVVWANVCPQVRTRTLLCSILQTQGLACLGISLGQQLLLGGEG